tara:strand:+ start:312 stop:773 length:462 start_codon:yes stop_codon:yes gene_type:complete
MFTFNDTLAHLETADKTADTAPYMAYLQEGYRSALFAAILSSVEAAVDCFEDQELPMVSLTVGKVWDTFSREFTNGGHQDYAVKTRSACHAYLQANGSDNAKAALNKVSKYKEAGSAKVVAKTTLGMASNFRRPAATITPPISSAAAALVKGA